MARKSSSKRRAFNRIDVLKGLDQYGSRGKLGAPARRPPIGDGPPNPYGPPPGYQTPNTSRMGRPNGYGGPGTGQQQQVARLGGQGPMQAAPGGPFQGHPFIPNESIHHVVPANVSESGSAPGTPNLASMVMRSFQPSVLGQTPLISSGAGVPNPGFNFGGGGSLPPGAGTMMPRARGQF